MKTLIALLLSVSFLAACTQDYALKNKALVLSAERFDNEVVARSKAEFAESGMQNAFADFLRKNSRIHVMKFEQKGDGASGELLVETVPLALDAELKALPANQWQAKVPAKLESKSYPITMKKKDSVWDVEGLPFPQTSADDAKRNAK